MTLWIVIPPGSLGHGCYYCKSRASAMDFAFDLGGPPASQWVRPTGTSVWKAGEWQLIPAVNGD